MSGRHSIPGAEGGRTDWDNPWAGAVFAFLFLVALYESWIIPVPVLLSVVAAFSVQLRAL